MIKVPQKLSNKTDFWALQQLTEFGFLGGGAGSYVCMTFQVLPVSWESGGTEGRDTNRSAGDQLTAKPEQILNPDGWMEIHKAERKSGKL